MAQKGITYATKLSGLASSLVVFLCCAIIFVRTKGSMDLNNLIHSLCIIVPAGASVGYLSHKVGQILDSRKKKKKLNRFIK